METIEVPQSLNELIHEIGQMDESCFPCNHPNNDEEVIGEVPLFARKAYALAQFHQREQDQLALECKYASGEHDEVHTQMRRCHMKHSLLMEICWFVVRTQSNNTWGEASIGIRQGWQVVRGNQPQGINIRDILGGLLGHQEE